jgi:hypothetical protein
MHCEVNGILCQDFCKDLTLCHDSAIQEKMPITHWLISCLWGTSLAKCFCAALFCLTIIELEQGVLKWSSTCEASARYWVQTPVPPLEKERQRERERKIVSGYDFFPWMSINELCIFHILSQLLLRLHILSSHRVLGRCDNMEGVLCFFSAVLQNPCPSFTWELSGSLA